MSVINTNVKALVAQESMRTSNLKLANAMERLSTGLRINSAKDDAAGLAITSRMTAQVRGMSVAIRNANDGISMAQTADGAYGQVTSMLQRMRELAVQASTGSLSGSDRESIQLEVAELKSEINKVADTTAFNGIKLLDGSATSIQLQTGANQGEVLEVGFGSVKVRDIGSGANPALTSVGGADGTFTAFSTGQLLINGVMVGASLAIDDKLSDATSPAMSSIAKAAAINRVSEQSGVVARVNATETIGTAMAAGTGTAEAITINGVSTAAISLGTDTETNRVTVVKAINDISAQTGVRAVNTGDDKKGVLLIADDGRNITIANGTINTAGLTGLAATDTYVGTYSLYSSTGGDISIEVGAGAATASTNLGIQRGTYKAQAAQVVTHTRASVAAAAAPSTTAGVLNGDTLVLNGIGIRAARSTDDTASYAGTASTRAASAIAIAAAINERSAEHGVRAVAQANVLRSTTATSFVAGTSGSISLNNISITVNTVSRSNVIQSINEKQGLTGVVASEYGQGIQLVAEDGRNIVIDIAASAISAGNIGLYGVTLGAGTGVTTSGVAHYSSVKLESDKAFRVERGNEGNSNFELLGFRVGTFGGRDTGTKIADVDVSSQLGAQTAISAIDSAIEDVASSQARSGAFQNRLEASVSVLSEAVENESAARGRILDTNYAEETTALAKAQIVQQAATAMLAQANQQSQSVLALLQ